MQVGQPHVRRGLGGCEFVHGRDESVRLLVHVLQEAEHAEVGPHRHAELRLGVSVVLRAVLLLLRGHEAASAGEETGVEPRERVSHRQGLQIIVLE